MGNHLVLGQRNEGIIQGKNRGGAGVGGWGPYKISNQVLLFS